MGKVYWAQGAYLVAAFDFKTDIKVELFAAPLGVFIIGLSKLDGTDVLAEDTEVMQYIDVTPLVSEINISNSISYQFINAYPDEAAVTVIIKGNAFDPRVNPSVRSGNPVKISAKDSTGTWRIIHHGRIRDISSNYNPENQSTLDRNTVQLNLDSPLSIANQSSLPEMLTELYDGQWSTERMALLVAKASINNPNFPSFEIYNAPLSIVNEYQMGDRVIYGETFGDSFKECFDLLGYSGWLALDNATESPNGILVYKTANKPFPGPADYFLYLDNIGENIQISDIDLSKSTDDIVNVLNVYPTWDTSDVFTSKNQDSIELYGQKTFDIGLNYTTSYPTLNQYWGNLNGSFSMPRDHIKSISTSPINRNDGALNAVAFVQAGLNRAILHFVDTNIEIEMSGVLTRVSHTITPDYWNTDLEIVG